jgi:hypothetical protein
VRRRQHRGTHHGRNEQRRSGGPADAVGNHAEILPQSSQTRTFPP